MRDRDHSCLANDALGFGLVPVEGKQGVCKDAEDLEEQLVAPGKEVPDPEGKSQDPMTDRDDRDDSVDEVCRALGRSSCHARWTKTPSSTRYGHEPFEAAASAAILGEARAKVAAREKGSELVLDEGGQTVAR